MAIDYTGIRADAAAALLDAGQTVTWKRATYSSDDPGAGTVAKADTDYSITAVVLDYKDRDVDGSLIQRGDKRLLLDAKGFSNAGIDPADSDKVTIDGTLHDVVFVESVSPGGTSVLFKAQVRAAG